MCSDYDVIVVGARVAGATLAALLGDAGVSVLLLDQADFPSTTCSTHFFRGAGMVTVLDRIDVLERVLVLGCPPLTHQLTYTDGAVDGLDGPPQNPGEKGYCLSVRREALDRILVERAADRPSVEFAPRTPVSDVLWDGERVTGVLLRRGTKVHAKMVVGADGRHSVIARKVAAPLEATAPAYRALYYRYVTGFRGPDGSDPDAPEFSFLGDEVAYIFPSDASMTCVALSVNLETFRWLRKDFTVRFAQRLHRHRAIASRVRQSVPAGRLLGCGPEPSYARTPVGPGWALVGDAALHQDPWSGLGIDMAGVHATFLADAIRDWTSGTTDKNAALAEYHKRRNEHALSPFRHTVKLAANLSAMSRNP
jgi:flavin-dependent dehydrogenase